MPSHAMALAAALFVSPTAVAAPPWPLELTGEVCVPGVGCAPMSITANGGGVLSITATINGLSYSSTGTWERRGNRVRVTDGSGSTYLGTWSPPCYAGSGTALGAPVTFQVCR